MEKVIQTPLKRSFITAMTLTVASIVCLSTLTILLCQHIQTLILPNPNEAYINLVNTNAYGETEIQQHRFKIGEEFFLPIQIGISAMGDENSEEMKEICSIMATSFTINKITDGYTMLPDNKKTIYTGLMAAKFLLPIVYSIMGIVLCAAWFYQKKLNQPITLLTNAAKKIAAQDLDFKIAYTSKDEMGLLCASFEEMRQALYQNNQELWTMMEKRRLLMASVAHDLRNPISIMEGYLEYLQTHIPDKSINEKTVLNMINQSASAAARLERYTDSLKDLYHWEEQELHFEEVELPHVLSEMASDFVLLGQKQGLKILVFHEIPFITVQFDTQILYRILENTMMNAFRFAKHTIQLNFKQFKNELIITVLDDGEGFSETVLNRENQLIYTTDKSGEHIGMGLTICDILSRKHGGTLSIQNSSNGGGLVTIKIALKCHPDRKL